MLFGDEQEETSQVGYWPSVSDLFMTLFIIGLAMIAVLYYVLIPKYAAGSEKRVIDAVGLSLEHILTPVNSMRAELGNRAPVRGTQGPEEIVEGLRVTAEDVVLTIRSMKKTLDELTKKNAELEAKNAELEVRIGKMEDEAGDMEGKIGKMGEKITSLELDLLEKMKHVTDLEAELNDKPPIIKIDEATREYRFASGSASMSLEFRRGLYRREFDTLAKEILERNEGGKLRVDTLEVIGHTDGIAVRRKGNLDEELPEFLADVDRDLGKLQAGSNNDLGLLRAMALRQVWEDYVSSHTEKKKLSAVEVRCYSAGQTLPPEGGRMTDPGRFKRADERSRRIEIRLTKLGAP